MAPVWAVPGSLAATAGITRCFLFLRVLRCFTSPRSLLPPYEFRRRFRGCSPRWVSPFGHLRLNAWLAAPRSFSQPPTSFLASRHLGIHHTPLVAYLPSSLVHPPPGGLSKLEIKAQAPALRGGPGSDAPGIARAPARAPRVRHPAEIEFYPSYAIVTERCGADRDRTDDIQLAKLALSQLSYSPVSSSRTGAAVSAPEARGRTFHPEPPPAPETGALVGLGGVEPPTSRLSGVRSNHLSYRPPSGRGRQGLPESAFPSHVRERKKAAEAFARGPEVRPLKTRQQTRIDDCGVDQESRRALTGPGPARRLRRGVLSPVSLERR